MIELDPRRYALTQDRGAMQWLAERVREPSRFTPQATCLEVMRDGERKAVAVYDFWKPNYQSMGIAIAGEPGWATKDAIRIILAAPFAMLPVNRLHCLIHKKNKKSRRLVEGVGFVREGVMKDFWGEGRGDAVAYRMLRKEWEEGRFR